MRCRTRPVKPNVHLQAHARTGTRATPNRGRPARLITMYAVILAGSSGSRQHPLRAADDPVSLRPTADGRTLLRRIAERIEPLVDPMDVIVVTDRRYGERVRTELPEARILAEPMGRNTAASLALATVAVRRPEDEQMLVICADHEIDQDECSGKQWPRWPSTWSAARLASNDPS